jgi:hypothetical protein
MKRRYYETINKGRKERKKERNKKTNKGRKTD